MTRIDLIFFADRTYAVFLRFNIMLSRAGKSYYLYVSLRVQILFRSQLNALLVLYFIFHISSIVAKQAVRTTYIK